MKILTGRRLADGVAAVHAMWGFGAFASIPAVIIWPNIQAFVFWPLVAMVTSWILWKDCPLTAIERKIRSRWDPERLVGHEGFLGHYLGKMTGVRFSKKFSQYTAYGYTVVILLVILIV